MTTLHASSASATAVYYAQYLAAAPGEVPGVWSGRQALGLGLSGPVTVEALEPTDDVQHFECRSPEQTQWLRDHARQAHPAGTTKVLVVTPTDGSDVVAYYAWCMASIASEDSPTRLRKGAGRYPQPAALLARLGVSIDHEGIGLGAALLADVISRTAQISAGIGCRGLLVHAESESARSFYRHLIPEFEPSPTDPLHLVLLMKDIRRTLRS